MSNDFRRAWVAAGLPCRGSLPSAEEMDTLLHAERLDAGGSKATYPVRLAELPAGLFVVLDGHKQPHLFHDSRLWPWTPTGYTPSFVPKPTAQIQLLTPPSISAILAAGYRPTIHTSAQG